MQCCVHIILSFFGAEQPWLYSSCNYFTCLNSSDFAKKRVCGYIRLLPITLSFLCTAHRKKKSFILFENFCGVFGNTCISTVESSIHDSSRDFVYGELRISRIHYIRYFSCIQTDLYDFLPLSKKPKGYCYELFPPSLPPSVR